MDRISRIPQKILYFLIALPVIFLLTNIYPYLEIFSVLILVFLGVIFFLYLRKVTPYHKSLLFILLIIFTYFILSYFFTNQSLSVFLSFTFIKFDGNFFFCYILFFILAVPFFDYKEASEVYFNFIFFAFSILGIYGIFEYFTHGMILIRSYQRMYLALNFAHNATGSIYAIASIFALIFFLFERKRNKKILYFIIFFILFSDLVLTQSRGSLIGFIAGVVFVLLMYFKSFKKFIIGFGILAVVSVPFIILSGLYKRFIKIFSATGDANTIIRLDLWSKAWHLFLKSPIFGIGFGRINDVYDVYDGIHLTGYEGGINFYMGSHIITDSSHAHNSYLQFLAETGLLGLGLLLLFWIFCFRMIFKAYFSANNTFSKNLHLAALSSIVILFVLALTENYFSASTVMVMISMVVSFSIGLSWQENNSTKFE